MNDSYLSGTGVVPGIAHAPAAWLRQFQLPTPDDRTVDETDRDQEKAALQLAVEAVAGRYEARSATASGAAREVLAATAELARDRGWSRAAAKLVAKGATAPRAVGDAIEGFVTQFEQLGGLMAERTTDLRDIRDRVTAELLGLPEPGVPDPGHPFVLLASDLAPADTAGLDPERTVALVTELGGPTSHTAIIARQLGIPCVVAVAGLDGIEDGTPLLVDGAAGVVRWDVPDSEADRLVTEDAARRQTILDWRGPAALASGERVQLLANVADGAAARKAAATAAEGVGLFRTELGFLSATDEPSAEQQGVLYREVLDAFPGQKVVIRTLDAGSDKPVPFVKHEHEENPALGVRGVRLSFARDGLLTRQLDGIAAARDSQDGDKSEVWAMAPMISTIDEARRFATETRARGLKAGIMVEVPSVALLAEAFLAEVDFMSIGTNDLTQYTMAADRLAADLANLTNPWQPAVLQLVARTAAAGVAAGKPVGVCGEAAADPLLACVLIGFGITSLSMAGGAIAAVGAQLGQATMAQCEAAARAVMGAPTADAARAAARAALSGN